jgi:hypothetical protein
MNSSPLTAGGTLAVYTGRTTSWTAVVSTCAASVLLALVAMSSGGDRTDLVIVLPLLLIAIGVLADVLTASSVRATAGPNGFTIRWGALGWPRCSYPLDQIARAEVVDLPWWRVSWGFWWTPKRTSCTVRSGPTVRLSLVSGRIVTVTVPEPAAAVAALRGHVNVSGNGVAESTSGPS